MAAPATAHIAAIHTLKNRLQLSEDDYRALLLGLTGKRSSKDMTLAERQQVRGHMEDLAQRMGLPQPKTRGWLRQAEFERRRERSSPRERYVFVLWAQLAKAGAVQDKSRHALNAFAKNAVGVDALEWCNAQQLRSLIDQLEGWCQRAGIELQK